MKAKRELLERYLPYNGDHDWLRNCGYLLDNIWESFVSSLMKESARGYRSMFFIKHHSPYPHVRRPESKPTKETNSVQTASHK